VSEQLQPQSLEVLYRCPVHGVFDARVDRARAPWTMMCVVRDEHEQMWGACGRTALRLAPSVATTWTLADKRTGRTTTCAAHLPPKLKSRPITPDAYNAASGDSYRICPVHGTFTAEVHGRTDAVPNTGMCTCFVEITPDVYTRDDRLVDASFVYGTSRGVFPPITDVERAGGQVPTLNQEPKPQKLYDGLPASACIARYEARQRGDVECHMSPAQIAIAREMWSARLRAKVREFEKPRLTIMVDDQDEP
jgi:hypothetical protein